MTIARVEPLTTAIRMCDGNPMTEPKADATGFAGTPVPNAHGSAPLIVAATLKNFSQPPRLSISWRT